MARGSQGEGFDDDEINLLDLLLVLARNWKMIVGTCVATFALACIYTLTLPNIFTATARILPPQQEKGGLSSMLGGMGDLAALAGVRVGGSSGDLYVAMLKSRTIADAVIEQFDLMNAYGQESRSQMYDKLNGLMNVSLGKTDGVISVSVDDQDPRRAAALANAFVEELKKLNVRLNLSTAGRERQFLEERLAVVGRDLAQAEDNLKRFQEEHKAIKLDEQAKGLIEAISRLKGELASKEVELGVLLSYQTEQNPQVRALRESISQIREQIRRLEQSPGGQQVAGDVFFVTSEVPELGLQFARLMRDYKVQETLFELLTKQYEVAKISEAKNTSTLQVLDDAFVPDRKSKPKRSLMVLVATFAAGFLAILVAFVREFGRNLNGEDRQRWEQIKASLRLRE
ncbi:GumC family protein [Geoalkalibacter sp.]|uniref:GumC family protein n=1 Tax=Geoalkalibacter sp. TaxID=3041440 RepID=UPI00272EC8AD|nr:Wzz/FepE/Etk N-terminal domain-containing protein [Geoalkalibacter sp.]